MLHEPLPRWSVGRVTLIGDACHAALPFLAQGAAMTIEDGFVLARCAERQRGDLAAAWRTDRSIRHCLTYGVPGTCPLGRRAEYG